MTTATTVADTVDIPQYVPGRWVIDPVHSDVSFIVRHMMVSKVRGQFGTFSGEIVTGVDPLDSSVTATIDVTSVDTNNEARDTHVRSADFFDVENHPSAGFRSTSVRRQDGDLVVGGDLTIKGVTRPVELQLEINGFGPDHQGGTRAGFSGRTTIRRSDFGIGGSAVANSVVVLGDTADMVLEIEAVLQSEG